MSLMTFCILLPVLKSVQKTKTNNVFVHLLKRLSNFLKHLGSLVFYYTNMRTAVGLYGTEE